MGTALAGGYSGLMTSLAIKVSSTFVTVAELADVEGPDIKVNVRQPNRLNSLTVTKRPTQVDLGKYKFTINYDQGDTTHLLIKNLALVPPTTGPSEFKVTYNDNNTTHAFDDFKGYVVSWKEKGKNEKDTVQAEVEIDVTDLYTVDPGTA